MRVLKSFVLALSLFAGLACCSPPESATEPDPPVASFKAPLATGPYSLISTGATNVGRYSGMGECQMTGAGEECAVYTYPTQLATFPQPATLTHWICAQSYGTAMPAGFQGRYRAKINGATVANCLIDGNIGDKKCEVALSVAVAGSDRLTVTGQSVKGGLLAQVGCTLQYQ